MPRRTEILIIGAGPAGLGAAASASSLGAKVILVDRQNRLGGQLVKQTHKFFGSKEQYASVRGMDIARILGRKVEEADNVVVLLNTVALGYYEDGVVALEKRDVLDKNEEFIKMKPEALIIATGASERVLAFPGCDLPGIYGAGAVQTLMNVYGVIPGRKVVMVGAGNIGLIVSYQLMQAGIKVEAIVEATPVIGGYKVHASKVARMGVPILTSHTVKSAFGDEILEGIELVKLGRDWQYLEGTEKYLETEVLCIAVGLSPLAELLWQAKCQMVYVPELGGYVALRDHKMETTVPGIYTAGDVAGVEEANTALVEGYMAGFNAAHNLGYTDRSEAAVEEDLRKQLELLRAGPVGEKIRKGLKRLKEGRR